MSRIIDDFLTLVQIDSETKNEKQIALYLKEKLENLGFDVIIDNVGETCGSNTGNVIGVLKGEQSKESILFSSHMDTVSPGKFIEPIIENGTIKSSTDTILGADDKSGIAAIIEAIKRIKENSIKHPNIEVVFTISEEGGLHGSRGLDISVLNSKIGYVIDSSGEIGGIVTQAPTQSKIKAVVKGIPSHAGIAPEKGVSAIMIIADAISNMKLLRIDEETTTNVGSISGGTATNIVAERCESLLECRSLNNEKLTKYTKDIENCFYESSKKYGGEVELETNILYRSFFLDENENVVQRVINAMNRCNIKAYTRSTGGGSDANNLNLKGIKTVNLNCGTSNVHTSNEQISIESLEKIADIVYEIIRG